MRTPVWRRQPFGLSCLQSLFLPPLPRALTPRKHSDRDHNALSHASSLLNLKTDLWPTQGQDDDARFSARARRAQETAQGTQLGLQGTMLAAPGQLSPRTPPLSLGRGQKGVTAVDCPAQGPEARRKPRVTA